MPPSRSNRMKFLMLVFQELALHQPQLVPTMMVDPAGVVQYVNLPASAFQPKEKQVQHQPQVPLPQISQQPQILAYWVVEQQGYQHQQPGVASRPMTPQHPLPMNIQSSEVDWTSKIAEVMQDHFGLKPKQPIYMYHTPYSAAYDKLSFPHRYKVPDFTKFSGQGDTSTIEHVNRFVIQCGEAAAHNALTVRLFSSSLSGDAFTWFTYLLANSVITWADLEKHFHRYFFSGSHEMKLTNLTSLRQRNNESVAKSEINASTWH